MTKPTPRAASPATTRWVELEAAEGDLARDPPRGGKLTIERVEAICASIATGRYVKHACQSAGISENAWADWVVREWVAEAYGRAHAVGVGIRIARAEAHEDAKVDLELLKAYDRPVFDPPKERRLELAGKNGGPIAIAAVAITPAQQRAQLERELAELDETAEDVRLLRRGE